MLLISLWGRVERLLLDQMRLPTYYGSTCYSAALTSKAVAGYQDVPQVNSSLSPNCYPPPHYGHSCTDLLVRLSGFGSRITTLSGLPLCAHWFLRQLAPLCFV
jgi:hypothetical protein